jgi:Na+/H+-translocating membrane pyrophosphatase
MLLPGIIAVLTPISVGLLVGAKCLGGLLAGSIASGFMLAVMMSNAGGAWDNCKKYIENEKVYGGKKSDTHKACVVGDTVGDPFKDTSGPALNILIKLMTVFSLTLAPVFRDDWETYQYGLIVLAVEILLVALAYWWVWIKNGDEVFTPNDAKHNKTTSD